MAQLEAPPACFITSHMQWETERVEVMVVHITLRSAKLSALLTQNLTPDKGIDPKHWLSTDAAWPHRNFKHVVSFQIFRIQYTETTFWDKRMPFNLLTPQCLKYVEVDKTSHTQPGLPYLPPCVEINPITSTGKTFSSVTSWVLEL